MIRKAGESQSYLPRDALFNEGGKESLFSPQAPSPRGPEGRGQCRSVGKSGNPPLTAQVHLAVTSSIGFHGLRRSMAIRAFVAAWRTINHSSPKRILSWGTASRAATPNRPSDSAALAR